MVQIVSLPEKWLHLSGVILGLWRGEGKISGAKTYFGDGTGRPHGAAAWAPRVVGDVSENVCNRTEMYGTPTAQHGTVGGHAAATVWLDGWLIGLVRPHLTHTLFVGIATAVPEMGQPFMGSSCSIGVTEDHSKWDICWLLVKIGKYIGV